MAKTLDIDTTTITVAVRALAQFKKEYPNRIPIWVKAAAKKLDIKIGSIPKDDNSEHMMRHHIYFHRTMALMEV